MMIHGTGTMENHKPYQKYYKFGGNWLIRQILVKKVSKSWQCGPNAIGGRFGDTRIQKNVYRSWQYGRTKKLLCSACQSPQMQSAIPEYKTMYVGPGNAALFLAASGISIYAIVN